VINYRSNGKIFADGIFSNGQPYGSYKEYDDSGEHIRSGEYENGEETGDWIIDYDEEWNKVTNKNEASFMRKINFTSAKGPWITTDFFITGEKQFEGMLAKVSPDVPAGKCIYYNKSGTITQEVNLDNTGNFKSQKMYLENGRLDKEALAVTEEIKKCVQGT
jgi:antitoxin component YwqK of YwqJK toxin-antitoxin module